MRDLATIVVITIILAFGLVIIYTVFTPLLSGMINNPVMQQNNQSIAALQSTQTNAIDRLDYVFLFIFIGLFLVCLITSWFIAAIPLFVFIYFILLTFLCAISAIMSFVWYNFQLAPELTSTITLHFPITNYIMENFLVFTIILGFLSMIVMYAKPQQMY
jgi:hypothetical protein